MIAVNISRLKNRLSHYLDRVRRGESLLVKDRDRPIARIDPIGSVAPGERRDRIAALEEAGVLRRPKGSLGADWLRRRPPARADLVAAVLGERENGR